MKTPYDFFVKGYKGDDCFYIVNANDVAYNVYQRVDPEHKLTPEDVKSMFPWYEGFPDDEVLITIPPEKCQAILNQYYIDSDDMKWFRNQLYEEEIS